MRGWIAALPVRRGCCMPGPPGLGSRRGAATSESDTSLDKLVLAI
jgi:hypothetical protein